jgi:hypothetical protein
LTGYVFHRDTLATADTLYVRNPERVLLEIDKDRSQEEAEAEEAAVLDTLSVTLDAVGEIADPPQSPEERVADAAEDERNRAQRRARRERRRARLGQRRTKWVQSDLRRTALAPGMRTSGFVVVPVDPGAFTLVLHVEARPGEMTVPFRQTRHEP